MVSIDVSWFAVNFLTPSILFRIELILARPDQDQHPSTLMPTVFSAEKGTPTPMRMMPRQISNALAHFTVLFMVFPFQAHIMADNLMERRTKVNCFDMPFFGRFQRTPSLKSIELPPRTLPDPGRMN
jgi:hypothetical protein